MISEIVTVVILIVPLIVISYLNLILCIKILKSKYFYISSLEDLKNHKKILRLLLGILTTFFVTVIYQWLFTSCFYMSWYMKILKDYLTYL